MNSVPSLYGHKEHPYANAFAEAAFSDHQFLDWIVGQTPLAVRGGCRVLRDEMIVKRPKAKFWWKNYWSGKCACPGCRGRETDILLICSDDGDQRFALHVEVKQPTDRFDPAKRQGEHYRTRAACWIQKPPKTVVEHSAAATILLCSDSKLSTFRDEVQHFDATFTFEEIGINFYSAVPRF